MSPEIKCHVDSRVPNQFLALSFLISLNHIKALKCAETGIQYRSGWFEWQGGKLFTSSKQLSFNSTSLLVSSLGDNVISFINMLTGIFGFHKAEVNKKGSRFNKVSVSDWQSRFQKRFGWNSPIKDHVCICVCVCKESFLFPWWHPVNTELIYLFAMDRLHCN